MLATRQGESVTHLPGHYRSRQHHGCFCLSSSSRIRKSGGCRSSDILRGSFEFVMLTSVRLSMDVILSIVTIISGDLAIVPDDTWSMSARERMAIPIEYCTPHLTHGSPHPNRILHGRTNASSLHNQFACALRFVQFFFKANHKSACS
jgi:hypothetical protein